MPPERLTHRLCIFVAVTSLVVPALASWTHVPAGEAKADAFAADSAQQRLWLGLDWAGLWRSSNGGQAWIPASSELPTNGRVSVISVQLLDAGGDSVILRATTAEYRSQIWYTFDGGMAWSHFPESQVHNWPGDIMIVWRRNREVFLHCEGRGFHRSTDSGATWVWYEFPFNLSGAAPYSLIQDTFRDSTLFMTVGYFYYADYQISYGGLSRSDDLGQTWQQCIDFHALYGLTWCDPMCVARLSNDELVVLLTFTDPRLENGTVIISSDDGGTWTQIEGGLPDRFMPDHLVEDPFQPGTLFISGNGQRYGLYWSHDYGQTWTRCYNGLPGNVGIINDLFVNPFSGAIYAAFVAHGVYVTQDHGQTWQSVPMPPVGLEGRVGVAQETVFFHDDGFRLWRLDSGNGDWTEMNIPLSPDTLVLPSPVYYHSGDTLVTGLWKRNVVGAATDAFQMTYSYDNGQTWQNDPFVSFLPSYFKVHRSSSVVRFVDMHPDTLRWTEDLGHTWTSMLPAPSLWLTGFMAQNDSAIYLTAVDSATFHPEVERTVDHGSSWQTLDFPVSQYHDYYPMPTLIADDLILFDNGFCWRWSDGNWEQRGVFPEHGTANFMVAVPRPDRVLLFGVSGTTNQAWLSSDTGATWQMPLIETPYPMQSYGFTDLKWDEARQEVWGVASVGTCYLPVGELSTYGPLHFLPTDFTVLSCYPSPFNSTTRIRFDLDREMSVKVDVFDLLGRHVCNLVDGRETAGRHEVTFDATSFSSGTYFVQLESDTRHRVQKILLLK